MVLAADILDAGFQFGDAVGGVIASAYDAVFRESDIRRYKRGLSISFFFFPFGKNGREDIHSQPLPPPPSRILQFPLQNLLCLAHILPVQIHGILVDETRSVQLCEDVLARLPRVHVRLSAMLLTALG